LKKKYLSCSCKAQDLVKESTIGREADLQSAAEHVFPVTLKQPFPKRIFPAETEKWKGERIL
jgi:hypothetical protein